jgi:hypothetical protein
MPHKVLILDDKQTRAQGVQWSAELVDRDAEFVTANTVDAAKSLLDTHISDYLYAVVDLDMGRSTPLAQQGETFLQWLSDHGALRSISVLVFSTYIERISELPRSITQGIRVAKRTASDGDNDRTIRSFVEDVMHRGA